MSILMPGSSNGRGAKIPRPMNAFMIFAKEYRPRVKQDHPNEENHVISVRLGNMWATLPAEEKEHFQALSRKAGEEHRIKYPDYRYEPKPKIKKKRRYDQYIMMDRLRREGNGDTVGIKEEKDETITTKGTIKQCQVLGATETVSAQLKQSGQQQLYRNMQVSHGQSSSYHQPVNYHQTGMSPVQQPVQYTHQYMYSNMMPPQANVVPAHQYSRPHMYRYGVDPYSVSYMQGAPPVDVPLDMSTRHLQSKPHTVTTDPSGKVYCELTPQPGQYKLPPASTLLQGMSTSSSAPSTWTTAYTTAYTEHRPDGKEGVLDLQKKDSTQIDPTTFVKSGDGKTDLVWIPCEPDFARKLGWSLDQSYQQIQ